MILAKLVIVVISSILAAGYFFGAGCYIKIALDDRKDTMLTRGEKIISYIFCSFAAMTFSLAGFYCIMLGIIFVQKGGLE